MSSSADRVLALAKQFMEPDQEPTLTRPFAEVEVSSMDAIAFAKSLEKEFDREISAEDFSGFKCLGDIAAYFDA